MTASDVTPHNPLVCEICKAWGLKQADWDRVTPREVTHEDSGDRLP